MAMGMLLSALSGAGTAAQGALQQDQRFYDEQSLIKERADIEEQKQKTLAMFKNQLDIDTARAQRNEMTGSIQAAQDASLQQGIVDKANAKYDYTDEQGNVSPAAYDEIPDADIAEFQPSPADKQAAYRDAVISTGYVSPEKALTMSSREDIAAVRAEGYANRTEMMQKLAEITKQAKLDAIQMRYEAEKEKTVNGKVDAATGRMLITSEDANMRATTSQLSMLNSQLSSARGAEKAAILDEIKVLREDLKASKAAKNAYLKSLGLPSSADTPIPGIGAAKDGVQKPLPDGKNWPKGLISDPKGLFSK